jgi:outer membrane protein OmpA-like peptidoglycan-associated protein
MVNRHCVLLFYITDYKEEKTRNIQQRSRMKKTVRFDFGKTELKPNSENSNNGIETLEGDDHLYFDIVGAADDSNTKPHVDFIL